VKFSDGADLTGTEVAAALQPLLPRALEVTGAANFIIIQSQSPAPDLLELLASGRYFIVHAASDGSLAGTGAFTVAAASASSSLDDSRLSNTAKARLLRLQANPDCWAGRPYVNSIEIRLGIPSLRAMFDVQLGKADIALLTPDVARRAAQSDLRVWNSVPVTLYALQFQSPQKRATDDALRQTLSLSLDRATMAGVLLQKQAEPAAALLPQWLSGYAFLFDMETNQDLAQKLQKTLPAASAGAGVPLRLRIDAPGEMTRLLGERVVVNARQAGLSMQLAAQSDSAVEEREVSSTGKNIAGETFVRLFAWRYTLLSPRAEMGAMVNALHLENVAADTTAGDSGQLYEAERALLDEKEILPLVILPDYVGLSPAVRDWLPTNWGEWNLADVWLDRGEQTSPIPSDAAAKSGSVGARP
jgi:MarR-like DNA-binding transcriptional regulator SgrR of sgrS sRNA